MLEKEAASSKEQHEELVKVTAESQDSLLEVISALQDDVQDLRSRLSEEAKSCSCHDESASLPSTKAEDASLSTSPVAVEREVPESGQLFQSESRKVKHSPDKSLMQGRFPYFIHEFEPCHTIRTASCRHGVFSYCPPNKPWHPSSFVKLSHSLGKLVSATSSVLNLGPLRSYKASSFSNRLLRRGTDLLTVNA